MLTSRFQKRGMLLRRNALHRSCNSCMTSGRGSTISVRPSSPRVGRCALSSSLSVVTIDHDDGSYTACNWHKGKSVPKHFIMQRRKTKDTDSNLPPPPGFDALPKSGGKPPKGKARQSSKSSPAEDKQGLEAAQEAVAAALQGGASYQAPLHGIPGLRCRERGRTLWSLCRR